MVKFEKNGLPLLGFETLNRVGGLVHAVSTRHGGKSQAPFDSLNLALGEDDPDTVESNLASLQEALGLERLVFANQVHGDVIVAVNGDEASPVTQADGLATDQPGVGLLIKQADCQAIILACPEKGVAANLHVGWRGNVQNMPGKGVAFLQETYGVAAAELWAAVSPSLGPCCAEFVNHKTELPAEFSAYKLWGDNFDLWQITWDQLTKAGVRPERIEMSGICTKCADKFFSYRREGLTGRFGTVAALTGERPQAAADACWAPEA